MMTHPDSKLSACKIAVVGGGIAGLSFALALHQRGLTCDVYESVSKLSYYDKLNLKKNNNI